VPAWGREAATLSPCISGELAGAGRLLGDRAESRAVSVNLWWHKRAPQQGLPRGTWLGAAHGGRMRLGQEHRDWEVGRAVPTGSQFQVAGWPCKEV
jgi:hypothetical protein